MKSTKSLLRIAEKSFIGTVILATTMTWSFAVHASDSLALLQRTGITLITELTKDTQYIQDNAHYLKEVKEWKAKWDDIKTNTFDKIQDYKTTLGERPTDEVTVTKVDTMVRGNSTSLSTVARFYFPDDTACKQGSGPASITGSLLGGVMGDATSPPKARLEQICIKQKELAAMTTQENLNFSKIIEGYDRVLEKLKNEKTTTTGQKDDVAMTLANFTATRDNEMARHNTVLAFIQNQSENLNKTQRDVEALMLRGKTTPTVLGNATQTAIIGAALAGTPRGIKGTDASRAYAN
jgi:hypothetical protein